MWLPQRRWNNVAAVATMPGGKALGVDEVPVELLKNERVQEILLPILNNIDTAEGEAPDELLLARLIAIFKKKGSAADANNYRGIALMSLCAKLRNKMLLLRMASDPDAGRHNMYLHCVACLNNVA